MADIKIEVISRAKSLLSMEEGRLAGKITGTERDLEVTMAIASAQEFLEADLSRQIGSRTLKVTYGQWSGSAVLPYDPTSVIEVTAGGAITTDYRIDGRYLTVNGEPPVTITFECGWNEETVPSPIKQAMMMIVADLLSNTQAQTEVLLHANAAVEALTSLYRLRLYT